MRVLVAASGCSLKQGQMKGRLRNCRKPGAGAGDTIPVKLRGLLDVAAMHGGPRRGRDSTAREVS